MLLLVKARALTSESGSWITVTVSYGFSHSCVDKPMTDYDPLHESMTSLPEPCDADDNSKQPILIVTGMHRSGTSLMASLLQAAGLNIGQDLLEANEGNPVGYFENVDFLNFHETVLDASGLNRYGWSTSPIDEPPAYYFDQARDLIARNASKTGAWGWKEPRTVLFLNFWRRLLPEAKYVFTYRAPWEVLDSLYRRGDPIFHHHPEFALKVWMSYNQVILDFCQTFSDRCLLMHINQIAQDPERFIQLVQDKLAIPLQELMHNLYDEKLLKQGVSSSQRPALMRHFFPETFQLYQDLNRYSGFLEPVIDEAQALPATAWILQDWLDLRKQERDYQFQIEQVRNQTPPAAQAELEQLRSERDAAIAQFQSVQSDLQSLPQLQTQLAEVQAVFEQERSVWADQQSQLQNQLQSQLDALQDEFDRLNYQLLQTQNDLFEAQQDREVQRFKVERLQIKIQQVRQKMKQAKSNLAATKVALADAQNRVSAMETSKFWKFRTTWFRIKRLLGLPAQD